MASKEEFIAKVKDLPGVGQATAETLYEAGYTDLEQLKAASVEELQEKGLGKRAAEAVLAGLTTEETAGEVQVVEEEEEAAPAKAEEKAEIVEEEQVYVVRPKPELSEELEAAIHARKIAYKKQPTFKRYHHWYKKGLRKPDAWRTPRGTLNKQRRGFGYRPPRVKAGYGKPAITRGLHPSGFEEVLVYNVNDLEGLDPKTQAARVGGSVGGRKRKAIQEAAEEKGIRVLNPRRFL